MSESPMPMPYPQTSYVPFDLQPFRPVGNPALPAPRVKYVVGAPKMPLRHHRSQTLDSTRSQYTIQEPSSKPARRSTYPSLKSGYRENRTINRSQSSYFLPSPYSHEEVHINPSYAPRPAVPFPQPHIYCYHSSNHPDRRHSPDYSSPRTYDQSFPALPYGGQDCQGIISDDIRLDLVGCDVLVRAVKEIEGCAAIFSNWVEQIDIRDAMKGDKYERRIAQIVYDINNDTVNMVNASHNILRTHQALARLVQRRLNLLASSGGGDLFPPTASSTSHSHSRHLSKRSKPDDFRAFAADIKIQCAEISSHVRQMYEKLSQLVDDVNTVKGGYRMKKKVWNWISKVFSVVNGALTITGAVSFFHPLAPITVPITSASQTVASIAVKVCEKVKAGYDTRRFEDLLVYIKREIPRSVELARRALTSFECDLLHVFEEVDRGETSGWISASEAARASKNWRQALARLEAQDTSHQSMLDVTIGSF